MPMKLPHNVQISENRSSSTPSIPTAVVHAACPEKLSTWLGKLLIMAALAAVLVSLPSRQEVGGPWSWGVPLALAQSYQGFGASTPGGSGQPVYRVKTLADSGSGSLREAVAQGNRSIVFDVAGEIKLSQDIWVYGSFLTIDGTTAPAPGITLKYGALLIHGDKGAHDIIVRSLRSRDSQGCDSCATTGAGIGIRNSAYNVVLDHVSVQGAQDQALSISGGAHDVTVQYSIFAESKGEDGTNLPIIVSSGAKRVSFHHNLLIKGYERLPQVKYADDGTQASDTQVDLRNNLIWDWGYAATQVWKGARANVVNNYYYDPSASDNEKKRAIYICKQGSTSPQCQTSDSKMYARAYVSGNVSGHGASISDYLNSLGTDSKAFSAPSVSTSDACTAADQVLDNAGTRPLDSVDSKYVGMVSITSCATSLSRSLE